MQTNQPTDFALVPRRDPGAAFSAIIYLGAAGIGISLSLLAMVIASVIAGG